MFDLISAAIPSIISSFFYIICVIVISQAVFRFAPIKVIHSYKKVTVFIIATIIALPFNIIYWITFPELFKYCVSFEFLELPYCTDLPGWTLAAYQSCRLFISYLIAIIAYDKIVKRIFEDNGFQHKFFDGDSDETNIL